jgi:hypothetical protein
MIGNTCIVQRVYERRVVNNAFMYDSSQNFTGNHRQFSKKKIKNVVDPEYIQIIQNEIRNTEKNSQLIKPG